MDRSAPEFSGDSPCSSLFHGKSKTQRIFADLEIHIPDLKEQNKWTGLHLNLAATVPAVFYFMRVSQKHQWHSHTSRYTYLIWQSRIVHSELAEMLLSRDVPTLGCTHPCNNCLGWVMDIFEFSTRISGSNRPLASDVKLAHKPPNFLLESDWYTGARIWFVFGHLSEGEEKVWKQTCINNLHLPSGGGQSLNAWPVCDACSHSTPRSRRCAHCLFWMSWLSDGGLKTGTDGCPECKRSRL